MKRKRLASLALAAIMTASTVLAGCGQGKDTTAPAAEVQNRQRQNLQQKAAQVRRLPREQLLRYPMIRR